MAAPKLPNWREQILKGVGAPVTPQNLRAIDAWTQAEGGTAANNPFNTTEPMPGATPYNTLGGGGHVYSYQTPQQGIQATITTLKGAIGNYAPIVAALRAGNDPMAVARAIAGSQWGTGSGVLRVLGDTSTTKPTGLPASAPPSGLPQALPPMKVPGLVQPGFPDLLPSLLSGKSGGALANTLVSKMLRSSDQAVSSPPRLLTTASGTGIPLPPSEQPPAGSSPPGVPPTKSNSSIVDAATAWLGTPYSWGGGGPGGPSLGFAQGASIKGFDCSSLLQYATSKVGIAIPRTTYDQWKQGQAVPKENLRPGDAVFFHPGSRGPEHVGIYMGGGQFVEAPHTGADVRVSSLSSRDDYMGARRYG